MSAGSSSLAPSPSKGHRQTKAARRAGVTTEYTDLSLHSACATGNLGLVKFALTNLQPVNSVLNGVLPLHAAASSGNVAIVQMLIDYGADVNAPRLSRRHRSDSRTSGLAVGTSGSTPLHFAAANGHVPIIALLLSFGATASLREKYGLTAEQLAIQKGHGEAAEMLRNWIEEEGAPMSSGASQRSLGKRRLSNVRSSSPLFPLLARASSTVSSIGSTSEMSPTFDGSSIPRRLSNKSHLSDGSSQRRRSNIPTIFRKAAHPAASIKHALGLGQGSSDSASIHSTDSRTTLSKVFWGGKTRETHGKGAETEDTSSRRFSEESYQSTGLQRRVSSSQSRSQDEQAGFYAQNGGSSGSSLAVSNTSSSSFPALSLPHPPPANINASLANTFYRPRQSSQLSGRSAIISPRLPVSPHVFDDDDDSSPDPRSTVIRTASVASSRQSSSTGALELRRAAATRDRTNSQGSNGSVALPSTLDHRYSSDAFVHTEGKIAETRTSRSNSAGTDGRYSSPGSSYTGPGPLSTYAASNSTAATSVYPSSLTSYPIARPPLLSPLYEQGPLGSSNSHHHAILPAASITTSAQARTRVKKAEQDLLAFDTSQSSDSSAPSTRLTLSQQLAAYGQSISLEKKLMAQEGKSGAEYRYETIAKDGSRYSLPSSVGRKKDGSMGVGGEESRAFAPTSNSTLTAKSPLDVPDDLPKIPIPQWRAIPTQDRLMPPPNHTGRRSVSPGIASKRTSKDQDRLKEFQTPSVASSSTSSNHPAIGSGGVSYVEVVPATPTTSRLHRPLRNGSHAASKSDRTHSNKGGSATSSKDQVLLDALEEARIAAAVPEAKITVGRWDKKKGNFVRRIFS